MTRQVVRVLLVLLSVTLLVVTTVVVPRLVQAHGSMSNPVSRVYSCYLEGPETPDTVACRDAIAAGGTQALYDWNEVNIRDVAGRHREFIPDGKLCSAGRAKYGAFDQPRSDWATTIMPSSGSYTFQYAASTPHPGWFYLYVTRDGWDPSQPLKWSDLESTPFLSVLNPPVWNGAYTISGNLPAGKSGKHVIYSIWERTDSPESFYYCSDVWFGSSPTPTAPPLPVCTSPAWLASTSYPTGSLVSHNGAEWRARWASSGQEPSTSGQGNAWELQRLCRPGNGTPVPTATRTATAVPTTGVPTATRTATSVPTGVVPTATRTATSVPTSVVPTATRTATAVPPTATPGTGGACVVTYTPNSWGNGFTAEVSVRNNGTSPITNWALAWTFGGNQTITNMWNAAYTQSGTSVTVRNQAHNATIPAGGSQGFGFQATYSGTNARPASFTLNGAACSVQ